MNAALKQYAWEGTLVAIIVGVIMTDTVVTHLSARPDLPPPARTGLAHIPSAATLEPTPAAPSQQPAVAVKPAKSSNPLEVVLGPPSIGGQFTLLTATRTTATPTSDKLTLHLRIASRAIPDLVTPLQYVTLEIYTPGLDPITLEHPFSHPIPAGNTQDQDIAFIIPATLSLAHTTLRIHFYNEQKDIPLALL